MSDLGLLLIVANVAKSVARICIDVSEGLNGKGKGTDNQEKALLTTFDELISAAKKLDKSHDLPQEFRNIHLDSLSQAKAIDTLLLPTVSRPRISDSAGLNFIHSRIEADQGKLSLLLGQSHETSILSHKRIDLDSTKGVQLVSDLPSFKITMLGDTGVGKTVFMATMYAKLTEGIGSLHLRATDEDVERELSNHLDNLFERSQWPLGNEGSQKTYGFELISNGKPIAYIDWVDYRGGDIDADKSSEGAKKLVQRVSDSHAVLWIVDMSKLGNLKADSVRARFRTKVRRMHELCSFAMRENSNPKSWIFVRTKVDEVRDAKGDIDWEKAVVDFKSHLGDTTNIVKLGAYSRAHIVPISAVGSVRISGEKRIIGEDDPKYVEWPLLLALASLLAGEAQKLEQIRVSLASQRHQPKQRLKDFITMLVSLGTVDEFRQLPPMYRSILERLWTIRQEIHNIVEKCPDIIEEIDLK